MSVAAAGTRSSVTLGRVVVAVLAASACSWILATCVFVDFQGIRIRLVREAMAAQDGPARVELRDERARDLRAPFALIARVRNEATTPRRFSIRLDDRVVCDLEIPASRSSRVDCAVGEWNGAAVAQLTVEPVSPGPWVLEYVELATHHGRSTGWLDALVLPRGAVHVFSRPRLTTAILAGVLVAALLIMPGPQATSQRLGRLHGVLSVVAILPLAVAIAAPRLSPYRVVLSVSTFALWTSMPLLPRLWRLGTWLVAPLFPLARPMGVLFRRPQRVAWGLAIGYFVLAIALGERVVGASDQYGYVSQADLWLSGELQIDQPFVADSPWPQRMPWWFSPLGYRPHHANPAAIVPVYSPGLPLMLAIAKFVGGQDGMFFVVPLCGALLILATYAVGRRIGSGIAPIVAAWLIATSPVVLSHGMLTMSDVPVAAAWTWAFYFLLGTGRSSAAGAGLLSGMAVLIRPNLAPLAAIFGFLYVLRMREAPARAFVNLVIFGLTAAPAALIVAAVNNQLYGSPLTSGYGRLADLFEAGRMFPNLWNYLNWLGEAHTPTVFLGLGALLFPARRLWPDVRERAIFLVIGAFVAALWAVYCAWFVFDSWWYQRFLLSSYPFFMIGVGVCADALFRLHTQWIRVAVVIGLLAIGAANVVFASSQTVFEVGPGMRRFAVAAWLTRRVTEPNSVVIALNHSGPVRYYGERMTLNAAHLEDGAPLDDLVAWLRDRGVRTYATFEDWELKELSLRFPDADVLDAFARPPLAVFKNPGQLMVYELSAGRRRAREPVVIDGFHFGRRAVRPGRAPTLVIGRDP